MHKHVAAHAHGHHRSQAFSIENAVILEDVISEVYA